MTKIEAKLRDSINVLFTGCTASNCLRSTLEQYKKQEEALTVMENMADKPSVTVEEYANEIGIISGYSGLSYEWLERLSDLINDESFIPKENISSLKKRIKYCKNPMEGKKLQQELNSLYKEQKGSKKH